MIDRRFAILATIALAMAVPARAQLSNMLQGAMGSSQTPSTPGQGGMNMGGMNMGGMSMGGMGLPSVGSASPTNLAGVLQYCVQNNYLGGMGNGDASPSSVKDSLLSKFTGSSNPPPDNSAFSAGSAGDLATGNGGHFALGGTGLKAQITQKVCDQVLKHSQSLL